MADTHETIADIIAEMRGDGHTGPADALEWVRIKLEHYADRLDAAHKREIDEVTGLATKYRTALARINTLATYCHQPDTRAQIIEQCENIFAEERNGKTKEMEVANGK